MTREETRILVAEDSPAIARVLCVTLQQAGFSVTLARDGCEAWERAGAEQYDLLVTDEQMPHMCGTELCARLRALPSYADVPIVLLTAKVWELDEVRLRDVLRVTEVISKPFSPRTVADCLHRLLATACR